MSHSFEVTESQLLVDAPVIAVRRDTLVMPGGETANREIVEHFGAVAVVALDDEGRIAVVEQFRPSVRRRLRELPAGILDFYEEDELEAAKRELQEEAGLAADNWGVLVDVVTSPGFAEEAVRIYLARGLSEVDRPEAEDEEADMDLSWMPLEDAHAAVMRGEIVNSIAVTGILAASEVVAGRAALRDVSEPFEIRPTTMASRRAAQGIVPDMKRMP